jgi:hypothetical protein
MVITSREDDADGSSSILSDDFDADLGARDVGVRAAVGVADEMIWPMEKRNY